MISFKLFFENILQGDSENYFAKPRVNQFISNYFDKEKEAKEFDFKIESDLSKLPDACPPGFWVTREGAFIAVPTVGHEWALKKLYPDKFKNAYGAFQTQNLATKNGFVRIGRLGQSNTLEFTYNPLQKTDAAINTAKNIAAKYGMEVKDDFEGF